MKFAPFLRAPLAAGALFLLSTASLFAAPGDASPDGAWKESPDAPVRSSTGATNRIKASTYRLFTLDAAGMKAQLAKAPVEAMRRTAAGTPIILNLPAPDGTYQRFSVEESSIMEPKLQAEFPDFRTYVGRGIDDPHASARISVTLLGFNAQVLTPKGAWYIDPFYHLEQSLYMSYYKRDALRGKEGWQCFTEEGQKDLFASIRRADGSLPDAGPIGGTLRTYRLACAANHQYVAIFGGTVAAGQAAVVVAVNRVTGVYEVEVGIRLVLIGNNSSVIYPSATGDPYSNTTAALGQNQTNMDAVIGTANYDIGHVFTTGSGGVAGLGVVCRAGNKARGTTGLPNPVGDAFYIDYVAHEMGHQFGGNHTFNSTTGSCGGGNRNASTAYEPGSGNTIMPYAGICGADDLQPHSDPYFHTISFDEIVTYTALATGGDACPTRTPTGNNPPTVSTFAAGTYTIPNGTPFALTASGSDPDGDPLSYCWEQFNLGVATTIVAADNGTSPIIRSYNPTVSPTRIIPRLSDLLANTLAPGEKLPSFTTNPTRTLNFRVTARDNRAGGGGVVHADTAVTVATAAGPFIVTSQTATGISYVGDSPVTVTWNVAGTTANGVNAANVNIRLSTDGGNNFTFLLAQNIANNGSATVTLPNVGAAQCRFKVEPTANIFFALNTQNFAITAAPDSDGDGESDPAEVRAGTDPQNANDYLHITSNTRGAGGETITFPSKLNVTYRIERSTDLLSGWTVIFSNIAGTGGDISRTDSSATGATKFFYRAVVVP